MRITPDTVTLPFRPPAAEALDLTPVAPVEVFVTTGTSAGMGVNTTFRGQLGDAAQSPVVFKHNSYENRGAFLRAITPCREKDVFEVVTSHIFHDELGLSGVTYREAYTIDAKGVRTDGIMSDFVPNMSTLETCSAAAITNPNQAVAQTVVRGGLLGDWDVISNRGNTWITDAGEAIEGDFGSAGQKGVSVLGIPNASMDVMLAYATPARVDPVIQSLKHLSDDDIRTMVDRQGRKWIHDWTPAQSKELSNTLIYNRNHLTRETYAAYYRDQAPLCSRLGTWAEAPAMLQMHWRNLKRYLTGTLPR